MGKRAEGNEKREGAAGGRREGRREQECKREMR